MKLSRSTLLLALAAGLGLSSAVAQDATDIVAKFDAAPVPMRTPPPEYPAGVQASGGIVMVTVVIDAEGSVAEAVVSKASDPALAEPSIEAIRKWRFKPAQKDGQAVKTRVTIPVHFNKA